MEKSLGCFPALVDNKQTLIMKSKEKKFEVFLHFFTSAEHSFYQVTFKTQ
jgi:hypothetical protein